MTTFMETVERHYDTLAKMLVDFADYTPEQAATWRQQALGHYPTPTPRPRPLPELPECGPQDHEVVPGPWEIQ